MKLSVYSQWIMVREIPRGLEEGSELGEERERGRLGAGATAPEKPHSPMKDGGMYDDRPMSRLLTGREQPK